MKKEKTLRMAVTGALLLTVVAAGISMYRTDTTPKKESKAQQEEESKDVTSKDAEAQDTGELAKNTTENQEATPSPTMNQDNPDNAIPPAQEDNRRCPGICRYIRSRAAGTELYRGQPDALAGQRSGSDRLQHGCHHIFSDTGSVQI